MKNNYEVLGTNNVSNVEDYPVNIKELLGDCCHVDNFKDGDKVRIKYLLNTDGIVEPLRFKNTEGVIIETREINELIKCTPPYRIKFDNNELNDSETGRSNNWYCPIQLELI